MYNDATLWKLVDGELTDGEARSLELAAADDAVLGRRLADIRALKAGILDGAPEPDAGFADRTIRRVRASAGPVLALEGRLRRMTFFAAAASILAVGLIGVLTVGPLRAQTPDQAPDRVERRLGDFVDKFPDLTVAQQRQIRTVLGRLDREKDTIKNQLDERRYRQMREAENDARAAIREILNERQRAEFDRALDRK